MLQRTLDEILSAAQTYDVVIGPVFGASDVLNDQHFAARNNVVEVGDNGKSLPMPNIVPRISGVETSIRHVGPSIGADSDILLRQAGFSTPEVETFRSSRLVWT